MTKQAWISSLLIAAALWGVGTIGLVVLLEVTRTYNYVVDNP